MKSRTVELRLRVKYFHEDGREIPDEEKCKLCLRHVVENAVSNGLLSGDNDFCVDDYRFDVVTVATD